MSFELINPVLEPIRALLEDENISEIMVNNNGTIFIERNSVLERIPDFDLSRFSVNFACLAIARVLGEDISAEHPLLDARLPDGSRVAVAFPPVSLDGVTLTIRKFRPVQFSLEELAEQGTMPAEVAAYVARAVREHRTILISGGTGSGKTTLLNAMANCIDSRERIGLIEDTAEVRLTHPNLFRFEAKKPKPGIPAITIRDLLKASLRHRPDRIIVGEIRGGEAWDLLQAINTGHPGSLCTIHANSASQALSRLATLTLQTDIGIAYPAIQSEVGDLVDLVVQTRRTPKGRSIVEVVDVDGFDRDLNRFNKVTIYGESTERL
jgi:pilus assembly protein CpaF